MPPTSLSFTCTPDPAEAKTWFGRLIETEPIALSVIGSVTDGLITDPSRYSAPRWWAGRLGGPDGEVVAAFMHTPPHPLHVGLATPAEARGLAGLLAAQGDSLPGVGGRREPAEAFRDEWVRLTAANPTTVMEVGAFDLPSRPILSFDVHGRYRRATREEEALVDAWSADFAEAIGGPAHHEPHPSQRHRIDDGRVGLWEEGGQPVSMAYASPANGGVTRVGGVWTPPGLRGRGYASGVVAVLSDERMAAGERCMLYTDLANPTSNKIYQAMGYRRIGDNITIAFS